MSENLIKQLPIKLFSVASIDKQFAISRERGADFNQFLWVNNGSGRFNVNGDEFTLKEGEGVFIRHDVPNFYSGDVFGTGWCSFFCTEEFLNYVIGDTKYFIFKMTDYLKSEAEAIRILANGNSTTLALSSAGYSYVCSFFETVLYKEDDAIIKINAYLENNYSSIVSLDDLAMHVGMDKYALCKYYKKKRQTTIMDALLSVRISKAKRMLRYGNDNVEEIGKKCGFESPSYFCKRFREIVGVTPLQYRKNIFNA